MAASSSLPSAPLAVAPKPYLGREGLDPSLLRWWQETPLPLEGLTATGQTAIILPEAVDTSLLHKIEVKWNKAKFVLMPTLLGTPSIVTGILLVVLGIGGFTTVVSGWNIPALDLLVKYMPATIIFALTFIRAGIHMVFSGVKNALLIQRARLDCQGKYLEASLKMQLGLEGADELLRKAERDNNSLPEAFRIQRRLPLFALHGQYFPDSSSPRINLQTYKTEIEQAFALPEELRLPENRITQRPLTEAHRQTLSSKWYGWWERRLPALGALDMVLGQIMLFAGIAALVIMNKKYIPPGLDILAKDPSISVMMSMVLISNHFVNCSYTGWRMLNYSHREGKRAKRVKDLERMNMLTEYCHARQFHAWLLGKFPESTHRNIHYTLQNLSAYLTPPEELAGTNLPPEKPSGVYAHFYKVGKKYVPHLGNFSVILGILVTLLGAAFLGMSISGNVPSFMQVLTKNTQVTAIVAAGVMGGGLHSIHRGATLLKKEEKKLWKDATETTGEAILTDIPVLSQGGVPQSAINVERVQKGVRDFAAKNGSKWQNFWISSLKGMWVPDMMLGGFLLFCSIAGLAMCFGASVPDSLKFITTDRSFSAGFCASFLAIAIDNIATGWRMYNYDTRLMEDKDSLRTVKEAYERLIPQAPLEGARV